MGAALILDAGLIHSVVAIRCLGTQGIDVTAAGTTRWNAGRSSTYTNRYIRYPAPEDDPEGFVRAIEREVQSGEYELLLPIRERTVETVVKHRDRFEAETTVPFPSYDTLRIGVNKHRTVEAAREHDIPHPTTLLPGEADLETVEARLGYPVVAKAQHGEGFNTVAICESRAALERATRDLRANHGPVLYQEFIPNGGERGVYLLYGRPGEATALTVQQRLRTMPPSGGSSTYRETVADPALAAQATELLAALDWYGVAMAEFRIDARTGKPKLVEINPRLWGSLALSVYAGVNFPYLLYRLARGDDLEPSLEYAVGVQARCLVTDALQVWARDDTLRALREFLTPAPKPCSYDLVSRQDPLPLLGLVLDRLSRRDDTPAGR